MPLGSTQALLGLGIVLVPDTFRQRNHPSGSKQVTALETQSALCMRGLPFGRCEQVVLSPVPCGEQCSAKYGTPTEGARPDLGGQR